MDGKRQHDDTSADADSKRHKVSTDTEQAQSAAGSAAVQQYPGYRYDEASGWYINDADSSWQYNASTGVHYNAAEGQFYTQDPATNEFRTVAYDATTGTYVDAASVAAAAEPTVDRGLGSHELLPHISDYTFMQGRRPTQEDRHTMLPNFGKKVKNHDISASFYAVYDGHSGDQCSDFVAKTLHMDLAKELSKASSPLTLDKVKTAIKAACASTDKEFLRIAKIRKRNDGCCAIAALILDSTLFVINIGDSRAVLARDQKAEALSDDHKPEREDEKKRVEVAGGAVRKYGDTWRICTPESAIWEKQKIKQGPRPIQPAVARSFGDITLKTPRPLMLSEPEITVTELGKSDMLVLLGCDGIWDVLSNKVAVDTAIAAGRDGQDPKGIAGSVVRLAYDRGSTDNISVVAIMLHARPQ